MIWKYKKKTLAVERHNVGQEDEGVKVQKEDKLKQKYVQNIIMNPNILYADSKKKC